MEMKMYALEKILEDKFLKTKNQKEQDSYKRLGRLQTAWFYLRDTGGKGKTIETKVRSGAARG